MSKSSFSRHLLAIEMDLPAEMYTLRGLVTIAQSQKKGGSNPRIFTVLLGGSNFGCSGGTMTMDTSI